MIAFKLVILTMTIVALVACDQPLPTWSYDCRDSKCIKVKLNAENLTSTTSLPACRLYCGGTLTTVWPKPTGTVKIEQYVVDIETKIKFTMPSNSKVDPLWLENIRRFNSQINLKIPDSTLVCDEGRTLKVKITTDEVEKLPSLRYDTDESYSLNISNSNNEVLAEIKAQSFFGARHGLETLSQLIVYDEIRHQIVVLGRAEISDAPVYKHRGVLLDTGRNYISVKSIKRTIDAMAMNKLNRLHWHIVDSTSFPLVIKSQPDMHTNGAYSPRKIYTHEDVTDLVKYARARGVRIYPGLDLPNHVGREWEMKNMTVFFSGRPWPHGQLDPTNDDVYSVLEDIYREILEIFDPDVFHMGGSNVDLKYWRESEKVSNWMVEKGLSVQTKDLAKLWGYFQDKALNKLDKVSPNKKLPIVLWSNELFNQYIDNSRYIIQANTKDEVRSALENGRKVILSNYDALYLDCGFGDLYNSGNNWCSPYKGWKEIYENRPKQIAGDNSDLILGAEAANWSEQMDDHTVDARFWPRSSALAERMWSDPVESWRAAETRILVHRERLVENGIAAEALRPEFCLQNQNECP